MAQMAGQPYLDPPSLKAAFRALDAKTEVPVTLIVGGGTAMMLAYGLPVRTRDVDAYAATGHLDDLAPAVREVARELGLSSDWLNPHFETFVHVLPPDYGSRLREVFAGRRLRVMALGLEDLLVMKCFAGREKDVGHARALLRKGPDLALVDGRIQQLIEKGVKGAREAGDFLDDLGAAT
jgi:predicted nucleotidyltransferase